MHDAITPANRILVADDDPDLLALIGFALRNAGFEVDMVNDGQLVLNHIACQPYALLLLDIDMPILNGFVVCQRIREYSMLPILMLSARDQENDSVLALDAGADGYIVKPFGPRALIARIRALLRRTSPSEMNSDMVNVGKYRLDLESLTLYAQGKEISLTRLEAKVVHTLMLNTACAVSTKTLLAIAWSGYSLVNRNMLKQVVFRLRRKLIRISNTSIALVTVPGGYMWNIEPEASSAAAHPLSTASGC